MGNDMCGGCCGGRNRRYSSADEGSSSSSSSIPISREKKKTSSNTIRGRPDVDEATRKKKKKIKEPNKNIDEVTRNRHNKKKNVIVLKAKKRILSNGNGDGSYDFPYGYGEPKRIPLGKNKDLWKMWIRWITNDVAKSFKSKSWVNGMALAAMMSKISDEIDMARIKEMKPVDRITKALRIGEQVLNAEKDFFEADELAQCKKVTREIDQSIQLYLSEIQIKIDRFLASR